MRKAITERKEYVSTSDNNNKFKGDHKNNSYRSEVGSDEDEDDGEGAAEPNGNEARHLLGHRGLDLLEKHKK